VSAALSPGQAPARVTPKIPQAAEEPTAGRAVVLGSAELEAAHAAAAAAPPLTTRQRDTLAGIFGPHLRALHREHAQA
jgi:hypothetical protein